MKWFNIGICIIVSFSLIIPSIVAGDGVRPMYSFDTETVFGELPGFPDDFYEIRGLFLNQEVTAWQLGDAYLQPEFIDTWEYWAERVYGSEEYSQFGAYGAGFYPSRIDVFNVEKGDVLNISFFIKADWGIRFLQGCSVYVEPCSGLDVELLHPYREVLLQPTYPVFVPGWMQRVLVQIRVLEKGDHTLRILEGVPSEYMDGQWKEMYGDSYVSLGGLTRLSITINLHERQRGVVTEEDTDRSLVPTIFFLGFILIVFMVILFYVSRKKMDGDGKKAK